MTGGPQIARRPLLLTGLASAATTVLAACSSSQGNTHSTTAPAAAGGSLVAVSAVPVGGAVSATSADGKPVIVSQPTKGDIVAFTAICTHMGCTVAPSGKLLVCPCHGSTYNAFTGKNLTGPAPSPLAAVSVTVKRGQVVQG